MLFNVSALELFPLLWKIQAVNGKKRTLESKSAKQETEKPLSRLTVQKCLGDLPDKELQSIQGVREKGKKKTGVLRMLLRFMSYIVSKRLQEIKIKSGNVS